MPKESSVFDTDIAIVGGGLVGMAVALSVAQHDITSVLLEAQPISEETAEQFDDRTLVINPASQSFWQELGLWSAIEPHTTTINHVHVSNQGQFGVVQFDKDELEVAQLGHVVAAKTLANILLNAVKQQPLITYLQPAKLLDFTVSDGSVKLTVEPTNQNHLDDSKQVSAQLLIGADGVQSPIRSKLKLETAVKSYQRSAVICNVTTSERHSNRAFERLTTNGPMALLPFSNGQSQNRFGFVWSMKTALADELLQVDEATFLYQAQQQFGLRAGEFQQLGRRSSYPIYQIKVPVQHSHRVVLMGNAAHAVSPVSAQGLNLAVRGIARLSEQLHQAKMDGKDLGSDSVLQAYQSASDEDQQRTLNYTDDLMTWFKIDEPLVNAIRSMGLVAINANKNLKKTLFNTAGGLR